MNMFILLLSFLWLNDVPKDDNIIKWTDRHDLQWKDFKGPADQSSPYGALTHSGMRYSFGMRQEGEKISLSFEVFSYFDKDDSWVKKDKASDALLAHEQVHFDISEVFARKLHKAFTKYKYKKTFQQDIEAIFQKTVQEMEDFQKQYDDETDHSKNKPEQMKWEKKIEDLLK